jgi:hypothetical protein
MSSRSHPRNFPRELIDAVIDELSNHGAGLLTCALVHPTWRVRAQYHLYRDLTIPLLLPLGRAKDQLFRFANSLQKNPDLGHLVHSLTIQGIEDDEDSSSYSGPNPVLDTASFEPRCNALLSIIPLLKHIEKVTVDNCVDEAEWESIPLQLRGAMLALCFQSSVINLSLVAVHGLPVLPLVRCHNLECLELAFSVADPSELDAPFPLNSRDHSSESTLPRRLLQLRLNNGHHDDQVLRFMLADGLLETSALKFLSLTIRPERWDAAQAKADVLHVFSLCKDTLETYQLMQQGSVETRLPDKPNILSH